ncbi:hypothetical protein SMD44_07700 [Streptomyces alboflavus]|uniref:Uncharacterized protein n=1 Tax=Streptomyces alboflavus TaxID=67267 RepID=A0A1Z1WP61_9ACTN|nr:hypothetical protein SMD44_07700 [Streptomyces alboflavus]
MVRVGWWLGLLPPTMVRSVVPDSWPQVNVTSYMAPGLASQKTIAVADDWPLGMVTSSKTPDVTLVLCSQPSTLSVTWPPAAIVDGVTRKPNDVMFSSPATAADAGGAVRARAVAVSRAAEATRIVRMSNSSGSPRSSRGPSSACA